MDLLLVNHDIDVMYDYVDVKKCSLISVDCITIGLNSVKLSCSVVVFRRKKKLNWLLHT